MVYSRRAVSGFTLIEIMIALLIVGIVSAIGFSAFQYLGRASRTATEANLRTVQLSITSFHTDTGTYPTRLEDLTERPSDPKVSKSWRGPYDAPKDGWKHPFVYRLKPKGSRPAYELYSEGPNGEGSPVEEHISAFDLQ